MLLSEQDLSYYDGIAEAAPSWRQFNYWLYGTPAENFAAYEAAFDELARWYRSDLHSNNGQDILSIRLSQSILLAEHKQVDKALSLIAEFGYGEQDEVSQAAIRRAYGAGEPLSQSDWKVVKHLLGDGWFLQRLLLRDAEQFGNDEVVKKYQQLIQQNANIRVSQTTAFILLSMIPVFLGFWVLGVFFADKKNRSISSLTMRGHDYFRTWTLFQGAGVYFRSQILWIAYFLVLIIFTSQFYWLSNLSILWSWGSLFAALPMLYLINEFLLKPKQLTISNMFGLSAVKFGYWRLCQWSVALLAIDTVLNIMVGWLFYWSSYQQPLLEGISEYLLWGSPFEAFMEVINTVVWAPIMEEFLFRGLVYLSLRSVMKPVPAIIISASIFSALHFYSLIGFMSVFIAGAIWAWSYERSRSLLPGMIAHGMSNLFWASSMLLYYR